MKLTITHVQNFPGRNTIILHNDIPQGTADFQSLHAAITTLSAQYVAEGYVTGETVITPSEHFGYEAETATIFLAQ